MFKIKVLTKVRNVLKRVKTTKNSQYKNLHDLLKVFVLDF